MRIFKLHHEEVRRYALLRRNASSAVRSFRLPGDRIIEVGDIIEI